jgi:hypothetical protein
LSRKELVVLGVQSRLDVMADSFDMTCLNRDSPFVIKDKLGIDYTQPLLKMSPSAAVLDTVEFPISVYANSLGLTPSCRRVAAHAELIQPQHFSSIHRAPYSCCELCFPFEYKIFNGRCLHVCGFVVGRSLCARRCMALHSSASDCCSHFCPAHDAGLPPDPKHRKACSTPTYSPASTPGSCTPEAFKHSMPRDDPSLSPVPLFDDDDVAQEGIRQSAPSPECVELEALISMSNDEGE